MSVIVFFNDRIYDRKIVEMQLTRILFSAFINMKREVPPTRHLWVVQKSVKNKEIHKKYMLEFSSTFVIFTYIAYIFIIPSEYLHYYYYI